MDKPAITIFGSSTAYFSFSKPPGKSYVDMLKDTAYEVRPYCMNGYTIWHANYILPNLLNYRGRDNWVILHVGASETMTMKASNFLELSSYWLNYGVVDHYFMTFIAPKIQRASLAVNAGREEFFSLLTPPEFHILYDKMLNHLYQYRVLAVGMSNPNVNSDIRKEQAADIDSIIRGCCVDHPWAEYVDAWNLCAGEIVDSNHLTDKGHSILYDAMMEKISNG